MRRRRRPRPVVLPPLGPVRLIKKHRIAVQQARQSMAVFDAMPREWREFCASYGRNAPAYQLAELLEDCGGDVRVAAAMLQALLPVRDP